MHKFANDRVYLDANATSPQRPKVRKALLEAVVGTGNPSSVHTEGRQARNTINEARATIAAFLNLEPRKVTFVSGGSEANRLALQPGQFGKQGPEIDSLIVSAIEHPSVLAAGGFESAASHIASVDPTGQINLEDLETKLASLTRAGKSPLVSVMAANNETGILQPLEEIGELCRRFGALFHCDAAQMLGRFDLEATCRQADFVTLTAHKAGGPLGIGALISRQDGIEVPGAVIGGGGQESGFRAGTENLPAILGFQALIEEVNDNGQAERDRLRSMQKRLEDGLVEALPKAKIVGSNQPRLSNTTCLWLPDLKPEIAMMQLDLAGLSVSTGSACSSGKVAKSHVLQAMGLAPASALRYSLSWATTEVDIDRAVAISKQALAGR